MLLTDLRREETSMRRVAGPVSFDEAIRCVSDIANPLGSERISLFDASERTLAAPAIARRSAPPVAVSAMDGFAVRDVDLVTQPARLAVIGKSFAGKSYTGTMDPGTCIRVFTGAALPREADRVLIQENVIVEGSTAIIASSPVGRRHVRAAGSDFHYGQIVVAEGRRLRPQDLIAAAAADLDEVEVYRRPRVHLLCCGDELVPPGSARESAGKIPESISVGIAALIHCTGGVVAGRSLVLDDLDAMRVAARGALQSADVVVTIGGASVGEKDLAKAAFASFGPTPLFERVAIKPGKPVWLSEVEGIPVVGLPGNPTAALVTARLFLAPLITGLAGRDPLEMCRWRTARFDGAFEQSSDRDVFVRARSVDGRICPLTSQDSADQKALADTDVLARFRPGPGLDPAMEALVEIIDF